MLTFCNSYVLWLLHSVQLRLVTVTFCDINVVWCYVLSQYRGSNLDVGDDRKILPGCRLTANNFGLTYSRKTVSQNSFPNFIYIIPKSFIIFCQELGNPKRNMKARFEPSLPRMSSWKSNKHNTLDFNSGPLASNASILPLDHHSLYILSPQSCPCQDPSWGNKSAKTVKVTGKYDSPW
jgi:hypothetical protein